MQSYSCIRERIYRFFLPLSWIQGFAEPVITADSDKKQDELPGLCLGGEAEELGKAKSDSV